MRGQRGVCLLCRNILVARPRAGDSRLFASSRNREPYVLSRLVIDLDAADSKFVKRVEDLEVEQEEDVTTRNISSHTKSSEGKPPRWILNAYRLTPHDLLSYTFLGDINPEDRKHEELRTVLKHNDVYPMDSVNHKIEQLVSRFSKHPSRNLKRAGFDEVRKLEIATQISECASFWQLRRMVTLLSSTKEGCKFIVDYEELILKSVKSSWKIRQKGLVLRKYDERYLRLLNNLNLSLKARRIEPGPRLFKKGYNEAAATQNAPSMRLYSKMLAAHTPYNPIRYALLMAQVLQYIGVEDRIITEETRHELNSARNGNKSSNGVSSEKSPEILESLSGNAKDKMEGFLTYPILICILGEMGLKDELWREWIASENYSRPPQITDNEYQKFRAHVFATAFLLAKDRDRALIVLETEPHGRNESMAAEEQSLPAHGNIIQLVMQRQTSFSSRLCMSIFFRGYYMAHQLSISSNLNAILWDSLGHISNDSVQTLNIIQRFLLVESMQESTMNAPLDFWQTVDWGNFNGEQGLVVNDQRKTATWKATYAAGPAVDARDPTPAVA